jgi:hypothetical protein
MYVPNSKVLFTLILGFKRLGTTKDPATSLEVTTEHANARSFNDSCSMAFA